MNCLILFSTLSGTTEMVAKVIQKNLLAEGHTVTMQNVFDSQAVQYTEYNLLVVGAPTYDGGLEYSMLEYISRSNPDLAGNKIAVFGLGDTIYPDFCTSVDDLEKWIEKNGGTFITPSLRIDGYPTDTTCIDDWTRGVSNFYSSEQV